MAETRVSKRLCASILLVREDVGTMTIRNRSRTYSRGVYYVLTVIPTASSNDLEHLYIPSHLS